MRGYDMVETLTVVHRYGLLLLWVARILVQSGPSGIFVVTLGFAVPKGAV